MTAEALASTHAAAFPGKGWDAATFRAYLSDPLITLHGDATCFALIRRLGDEAEILTLAAHPDIQGQGRATSMLAAAITAERNAGTYLIFLEVAADNAPALALYSGAGFTEIAQRKDYYRSPTGGRVTALILRKRL